MGLMAIFQADPNLRAVLRGAALQLQAKKYACRRGAQNVCAGPTIAPSAKVFLASLCRAHSAKRGAPLRANPCDAARRFLCAKSRAALDSAEQLC